MFNFHLFNCTEAMNLSRKSPIKEFFPFCEYESKEECQLSQLSIEWKIRKNVGSCHCQWKNRTALSDLGITSFQFFHTLSCVVWKVIIAMGNSRFIGWEQKDSHYFSSFSLENLIFIEKLHDALEMLKLLVCIFINFSNKMEQQLWHD